MLTPFLIAVLTTLAAPLDGAPNAKPDDPQKKRVAEAAPKLECPPRKLKDDERSPEGERAAILGLSGVLRSERPLRYRTKEVPAGAYTLSVVASDKDPSGRNLFIVLEPVSPTAKVPGAPHLRPILDGPPSPTEPDEKDGDDAATTRKRKSAPQVADGSLRALMRLRQAPKPTDRLELTVRPSPSGDRFSLRVQAGTSAGQVTIRFVEAK